ncbi:hypothetical protein [Umezawaea beigongshangensis]|uniref:hypothetical protein n=1 Tax=Umezawaea beigongshangensis TaxID=2780383 RepID=UPI0018F1ED12|nr:hypothetical protein [Umezawaea beigongshangensis]
MAQHRRQKTALDGPAQSPVSPVVLVLAAVVLAAVLGAAALVVRATGVPGAVPAAAVVSSSSRPPSSSTSATASSGGALTGSHAASGTLATVAIDPEEWGTAVELTLRGDLGPCRCSLLAITNDDTPVVVATWDSAVSGTPPQLSGETSLRWYDIARFVVKNDRGGTLIRIPD